MTATNHEKLVGNRFGFLCVKRVLNKKRGHTIVECVCDCGKIKPYYLSNIRRGLSKSCGCYRDEKVRITRTTHGFTKNRSNPAEYLCWMAIRRRCHYKRATSYSNYGARGISVCERWIESFENFYSDMGPKPSPQHSIDRIDVNGNYEPSNCRWATPKEQAGNKRPYILSKKKGVRRTKTGWVVSISNKKLRYFKTKKEAQECRNEFVREREEQRKGANYGVLS